MRSEWPDAEVLKVKGHGGVYDVLVDGEVAFTKTGSCGPLPLPDEVVGRMREFLAGG